MRASAWMRTRADTDGNGTADDAAHERAGFVYGGQADWQLLEEWDGPTLVAERTRDFVYGNSIDDLIQSRDTTTTTPTVHYHHHDDLFSITATSDSGGAVVERYEYGDYGDRRVFDAAGSPRTVSILGLRQGFTGQVHQHESGAILMRNRYLSSRIGKWLQRDPAWYEDGGALTAYVRSNPLTYLDPFGLVPEQALMSEHPEWFKAPKRFEGTPRTFDFRWYGNWGGPGWANGRWTPETDPLPRPGDPNWKAPIDARDEAYMDHDYCINYCNNMFASPKQISTCVEVCDFILAVRLHNLPPGQGSFVTDCESWLFSSFIPWLVH